MTRITGVLSICLLATICFGQAGFRYHNSEEHFSFELPVDWEVTSLEELPSKYRQAINDLFPKAGAFAVCSKIGSEYLKPPYILVQGASTGEVSEAVLEKKWRLMKGIDIKEKTIESIQNAEGYLPKSWKGAELVEKNLDYYADRHISLETLKFRHTDVGKITVATIRALGNHRMVVLRFYLDGDDAENFSDTIEEIADSFSYDEGYMFGETKGVTFDITRAFTRNYLFYSILCVGGISILYMILGKWVRG